jgi:hypothetical protein
VAGDMLIFVVFLKQLAKVCNWHMCCVQIESGFAAVGSKIFA